MPEPSTPATMIVTRCTGFMPPIRFEVLRWRYAMGERARDVPLTFEDAARLDPDTEAGELVGGA